MVEQEIGVMAKHIVSMTEDRCSDYAVGRAVLDMVELAMDAIVVRQMDGASKEGSFGKPVVDY
jgi:hypothetical protein